MRRRKKKKPNQVIQAEMRPKKTYMDIYETPYQAGWMIPALFYLTALGLSIAALTIAVDHNKTIAELRFLISSGVGSGGGIFSPARTLFVAKGWQAGYVPPTHFTDVGSALTRASEMTPTSINPVQIIIYSGTYTEALNLVSNVHLTGTDDDTFISGIVTWNAGSASSDTEYVFLEDLIMTTLFVNSTGKPLFGMHRAVFGLNGCTVIGTTEFHMRDFDDGIARDGKFSSTVLFDSGIYTATEQTFTGVVTVTNTAQLELFAVNLESDITVATGSNGVLTTKQTYISGEVFMGNTTILSGSETDFRNTLTVDFSALGNILSSDYNTLAGTGQIDRRLTKTRIVGTLAGLNTVPVSPPYRTIPYKVFMTQISGNPSTTPVVLDIEKDFFTFNYTTAGINIDILIVM